MTIFGLTLGQIAGVGLLITGGGIYVWQWWHNRTPKAPRTLPSEAEFQIVLNSLREVYALAIAENKRQGAEIAAIRKVVGDPLPEPAKKAGK